MGTTLTAGDVAWRDWPKDSVSGQFITGGAHDSEVAVVGAVARARIYAGEPISDAKLIHSDRGFMSAILPEGKRAVAIKIAADTSAGGFILPNDHVDVIMTRRVNQTDANATPRIPHRDDPQQRACAGHRPDDREDDKKDGGAGGDTVVGRTATLELTPEQAKIITVAQQMSDRLNLALRSVSNSAPDPTDASKDALNLIGGPNGEGTVTLVKNGIAKKVTGVR